MKSREEWDSLSPLWDLCEDQGLSPAHFRALHGSLRPPALVLGAGQGLIVEALARTGVRFDFVLDFSVSMARAAVRRRGCRMAVGAARDLPVRDDVLRTVVCATGVLDPASEGEMLEGRDELLRVTCSGGVVVIAFFCPGRDLLAMGEATGVLSGWELRHDRILRMWRDGIDSEHTREAVADWTGCTTTQAEARIRRWRSELSAWIGLFDRLSARVRSLGADPYAYLCRCFANSLRGVAPCAIPSPLDHPRLRLEHDAHDEPTSTRVFAFRVL